MSRENSMREEKIYAPVIITTCNRHEHLRNCIESLRKCTYAEETEVYIGLDYPPSESYVPGWERTKTYLQEISECNYFKKMNIWFHESNLGAGENAQFLMEEAFKKYEYLIFTEDDNIFAPAFLDYMNQMLVRFEEDPEVMSITGFSFSDFNSSSEIGKTYLFRPWGNGKWKKKQHYLEELDQIRIYESFSNKTWKIIRLYFSNKWLFCVYVSRLIHRIYDPYLNDWTKCLLFYLLGYRTIFPTKSLVRNMGFDGTGESCKVGDLPRTDNVELYASSVFTYDSSRKIPTSNKCPIPEWAKKSSKLGKDPLTYVLYRIMGQERYMAWRKDKGI